MKEEKIKKIVEEKIMGIEYPDPTPLEIPINLKTPETTEQKVKRILQNELSKKYAELGAESWEEAHDFDVDDDFETEEPLSGYEVMEMKPEFPAGAPPNSRDDEPGGDEDRPVQNKKDKENEQHFERSGDSGVADAKDSGKGNEQQT